MRSGRLSELLDYVKRPIIIGRELTKVNEQLVEYIILVILTN